MKIYVHRVNTIEKLKQVPTEYGVELDIRGYGKKLLLNHDPIDDPNNYEDFEDFLREYKHSGIILNVKEMGYEEKIISLMEKHNITDYFFLDVEFPYIYRATRKDNMSKIAIRYSEAEDGERG